MNIDGELRSDPPAPAPRRRLLVLVAGTAAAVAITVSVVTSGSETPAPPPAAAEAPRHQAVDPVDVFDGPTRGSLAGDAPFLEAVLGLSWHDPDGVITGLPEPPADSRRVAYAADVPAGRWVLVVGENTAPPRPAGTREPPRGDVVAAWFTGPSGAPADQLRLSNYPFGVSPRLPMSLWDAVTGTLVVVAAPGDVVEVSPRPDIDAEGNASRTYEQAETEDGVAVVELPPAEVSYGVATAYRVFRDGALVVRTWPDPVVRLDPPPPPSLSVDYPRGTPSAAAQVTATGAVADVLALTGLRRDEVRATALWAGEAAGTSGAGALVTVTLPSGAVVVTARWQFTVPDGVVGADCGQEIHPASAAAPERRVYAAVCDLFDPSGSSDLQSLLLVVGPPEVVSVRVYGRDDVFLTEVPATAGLVAVPLPRGALAVEGVTDGGVGRGRVGTLGHGANFGS